MYNNSAKSKNASGSLINEIVDVDELRRKLKSKYNNTSLFKKFQIIEQQRKEFMEKKRREEEEEIEKERKDLEKERKKQEQEIKNERKKLEI